MHIRHYTQIIYILFISHQNYCTAWLLPMVKQSEFEKQQNVDNVQNNGTTEDPKSVIGIQITKFTREDAAMQIFDFDMDLARKFAYNEWQKLLNVYVPIPDLQVEQYTVRVPARDSTNTSERAQSKFMKSILPAKLEYDEDGPQLVAKALQDMHDGDDIHKGLK